MTDLDEFDIAGYVSTLKRDGCVVVPDVVSRSDASELVDKLWAANAEAQRQGRTGRAYVDPNEANVRVLDLLALDDAFVDLISHPVADAIASGLLGQNYIVSNFTANIARPGSGSMPIHSDQSFVAPEPWVEPWTLNIIWCLADTHEANGATRFVPGSHRWARRADVPEDVASRLVPFEARAGSIVAMEGRIWHTSGANRTQNEDRPLLFAYYSKPLIRPQWNFSAALPDDLQASFSPVMRFRLGLDLVFGSEPPPPGFNMKPLVRSRRPRQPLELEDGTCMIL